MLKTLKSKLRNQHDRRDQSDDADNDPFHRNVAVRPRRCRRSDLVIAAAKISQTAF